MSTRAHILIKDGSEKLMFYRHSDGYPEGGAGEDLTEFVKTYFKGELGMGEKSPGMRRNVDQSAGWLIVRGHFEYRDVADDRVDEVDRLSATPTAGRYNGWKVGAYEPTSSMHGDEEYIYIIDIKAGTLTCRVPTAGYWDKPCLKNTEAYPKFKTVKF